MLAFYTLEINSCGQKIRTYRGKDINIIFIKSFYFQYGITGIV